jgi:hypothetical protein
VPGAFSCMAGATNPGNIGHAWVKSLWIDKQPAPGMEHPEDFDASDYDFVPARVSDNPIYAGDENYLKTLRALPSDLKRAFLDGDWDVFAGQYFDRFDCSRHVMRAEQIDWKPWWPRWISIDWGFEHPAAVYWHAQAPGGAVPVATRNSARNADRDENIAQVFRPEGFSGVRSKILTSKEVSYIDPEPRSADNMPSGNSSLGEVPDDKTRRIISYREFVTHRTSPRDLAREIVARSVFTGHALQQQIPRTASRAPENQGQGKSARDFARDDSCVEGDSGDFVTPPFRAAYSSGQQEDQKQDAGLKPGATNGNYSREKIDAVYLSPDAFARRTDEASIADQMGDVFVAAGFPRPIPADNDRVGGWMLMYQMLDAGEWLLTENCVELIRTIPNLVRDPARVEDIEKMDGDDPADAARYGLKSRYGAGRSWQTSAPLEQRIAERVTSTDPFGRAMQIRKFRMDEKRKAQPVSFLHRHRHR